MMASVRWSQLTPVQGLLIAVVTVLSLPVLLPLSFILSPLLLICGLYWMVKPSQLRSEQASRTDVIQEPSSTTHNSALDLTPSAKSGTSTTDTAATVSRKASSAVPLKLLQIHNTEPEADGNGTDTISAASASKAHNSNSKPAIDVAEASAPVTAAPLTEVQNGHSKPANNTVGTSDTASSSASLTATQNGGMKQKNDTGSQPKQAHPKQQAAAPATGSAAILAKIRSQRGASAKSASANGHAASPAQPAEVIITYASQTGTAQEIARNIQAESSQHGVQSKVLSFNELGFDALGQGKSRQQVVVMIVSSTGEGDPPDNAVRFYGHSKRRSLASDALQHVQFTCLGLGDSNYTRYMAVPRSFKGRFGELGAQTFYSHMEADEVDGLEEFVDKWIAGLWAPLKAAAYGTSQSEASSQAATDEAATNGNAAVAQAGNTASNPPTLTQTASATASTNGLTPEAKEAIPNGQTIPSIKPGSAPLKGVTALPPCRVKLTWQENADKARKIRQAESAHPTKAEEEWRDPEGLYSPEQPFWATVSDARALTSDISERQVLHVEVSIKGSGMQYQPGDSIGVLPYNCPELVQGVLRHLGQDGQRVFSVASSSGDADVLLQHLHWPCSLERALTVGCDLTSVPRKSLLRVLAEHCSKPEEKQSLLHLCSPGGRQAYSSQIKEAQPSLLDLFHQYPSCKPPLAALLDSLPPLAPRMYSVSSSPLQLPNALQIAFTVVRYPTPAGGRKGVATTWLQQQCQPILTGHVQPAEAMIRLPVYLRRGGSFGVPKLESGLPNLAAPMLMIGPGTGVAPFRGFLQQHQQQLKGHEGEVGTTCLYFGCRQKDHDYLYRQDLEQLQKQGVLRQLHVAFSRAQSEKVYVQHLMTRDSKNVYDLLQHADIHVYVCGDGSSMAKDVHSTLIDVLQSNGNMTAKEANDYLTALTKQHRYIRDIWS